MDKFFRVVLFPFFLFMSLVGSTQAQSCSTYNSFSNNATFANCIDLPVLNAFLHWNYHPTNHTVDIAYRHTGVNTTTWVSWALNLGGFGMLGAECLVAFRNSSGGFRAYTSPVTNYSTQLPEDPLSFNVPRIAAELIDNEMIIYASLQLPNGRTSFNHVWQEGQVTEDIPQRHAITGSNMNSMITIDFLSGQISDGGGGGGGSGGFTDRNRNIHGVLNMVSWGILMPLGVIFARYLRVFKSADPLWFYLHVACLISAYIVGVAGWGIGLKLGNDSAGIEHRTHRNIGIALFCLSTLQVFPLLLRPNRDHKHRVFWDICHHGVGYIVIALSISNVFEGFGLLSPERKWKNAYIAVIITLGVNAAMLEGFTWSVVLKRKPKAYSNEHHHHASDGTNGVDGYAKLREIAEMASISDRIDAVLDTVRGHLPVSSAKDLYHHGYERNTNIDGVKSCKKTLEELLGIVRMFVDCVHEWTDADRVVPDLASLVNKSGAAMEEIASLLQSIPPREKLSDKGSMSLTTLLPYVQKKTELKNHRKWTSQVIDVLKHCCSIIHLLKQEIRQVYESGSLPVVQFRIHSPMHDVDRWNGFFKSINSNLGVLVSLPYFGNKTLQKQYLAFQIKHKAFTDILDLVNVNLFSPQNPEIKELMIHGASVSVRAAFLACEYWANNMESGMHNVLLSTLANLQQDMDHFTNPEFLDLNLRVLKTFRSVTADQVRIFLYYLLCQSPPPDAPTPTTTSTDEAINQKRPQNNRLDESRLSVDALYNELISLITSLTNIPPEYNNGEDEARSWAEVELLIMEVRSLQDSLLKGDARILFNLITKIWHIKIESFLQMLLTSGNFFQLSLKNHILALSRRADYPAFEEMLRYLGRSSANHSYESRGKAKEVAELLEVVNREVKSLNNPDNRKEITEETVRSMQLKLLARIVLFKAESFIVELSNINDSLRDPIQGDVNSLNEELKFLLMLFVKYQPDGVKYQSGSVVEDGKLIFTLFREMARGLISLCRSFRAKEFTEDLVKNMNLLLSEMEDQKKVIMEKLKEKYVHIRGTKFPKTSGLAFINSFLRRLRGLLNKKPDLFASMNDHIQEFLADLELLRPFLKDFLGQNIKSQELEDLVSRVVDVAYEAECCIDLILQENVAEGRHSFWFYHLLNDIRLLKVQITRINEKKTYDAKVHDATQTLRPMISNSISPSIGDFLVDLNDEEEVVIDLLTGGFLQRDIVLIFGMPGIGKSTLAKKVFNSPRVEYHFHIRAWCCVSQIYTKREVVLEILSHITAVTDNILEMTIEDLELMLYQLLKQKKYLIVMDDIWNTGAWDDLEKSFPNDGNGSRILVTSRLHDVLQGKAHTHAHALRPLSEDESWDLLQKKVFHEEQCPENLVEIGKQIAKNCKGLPLSVVAMAGVLQRVDLRQEPWKEISESLSSRILDDPETRCMGILELSYKHLPENLKACFLYFGSFPEDEDIPVQKLIRLWIAEGFVEEIELKNLEDLAKDYLMDLIGRSLVITAQKGSKGGVKACRVHDILRNLCLSKSKEEYFLQLVAGNDEDCVSFDDIDYGVDLDDTYSSNPITYEVHRLCIRSKRKHFFMSRSSGPRVRSLLFFASNDMYPRCPYDISFMFHNFKLLKVLDLECINMGTSFANGIDLLVLLRYLAVSGDIDSIPSSISGLQNLGTLIVKGFKGKVKLPDTMWFMAMLRHVHVSNSAVFSLQDGKLGDSCQLDCLITLSSLILSYGENSNKILRRLPNLLKLRCILLESREYSGCRDLLPRFNILSQLKSLKISYHGRALYSGELMFPLNLKKLTLSNFRLPWDRISVIGRLPNLEVLKLLSRAFEGETWDMIEGEFSRLKFLKLDTLDIAKWNATSDHLPNLQQLVLRCCKHLDEVPYSFGEIPTLEKIEVHWCGDSAEESVRQIREDAIEGLEVFILSDTDF